jgi:phosphopantothenoylcysteine decarboxylase/phosphopantothenate--cysteine ligase
MKIVVTCGPSYEPIDQARRITNFSTGRLGITLANALAAEGWEVTCFKGEQATCADPLHVHEACAFTTNQDLANQLKKLASQGPIDALFHAAALCDFSVAAVRNEFGNEIASPKFSTREGRLNLVLAPTLKVLPRLRDWFPKARIVGWKYELAGSQVDAIEKARQQLRENLCDACVVNGSAYGEGFGFCLGDGSIQHFTDPLLLSRGLIQWLRLTVAKSAD